MIRIDPEDVVHDASDSVHPSPAPLNPSRPVASIVEPLESRRMLAVFNGTSGNDEINFLITPAPGIRSSP